MHARQGPTHSGTSHPPAPGDGGLPGRREPQGRLRDRLGGRTLLDDFNGLEYAEHADNAFHAFSDLFHVLGLRVKESKAQPPQRQHVLQGVDVHVQAQGVTLSLTPGRIQKLLHAIRQALANDCLTPQEASRLAGKLAFLTQAVFGSVGKAAIQPLYARSHDTTAENDDTLSVGLRSSLKAIQHMLVNVTPRFIPYQVEERLTAVIFADAYVKVGETTHKADTSQLTWPCQHTSVTTTDNSWGYVVRIGDHVLFSHGATPRTVLDRITSRKAFIYALEILAQLMATLSLAKRLPTSWLAFIDNTAGEAALRKGWRPRFTRVEFKGTTREVTRLDDHTDAIIGILVKAAGDAAGQAVDDLGYAIN